MPAHDMSASTSNGSLRVVLYYAGAFVVSPHTSIKKYEAKKKMVKNNVEIKKLSVQEIGDMFSDVIGPLHWLYYFRNGVTPDNGKRAPKRKQMTEQEVEIREEIERVETKKETGEAQLMEEADMEMNAAPTTPRRSQRIKMPTPNVQQSHAQNGTPPASRPPSHGTCRRGIPKIPVKRGRPVNAFKATRNQSN
ncbi:hypothetical protein POM88_027703 [Heracleum sosnowskyi]|uniref:Uncharacterized protein n=1 Tax=Heracleum sosnowskyi TaxID=360622 RepID=A0AAD8MQE0_9APIA|nr:hypothetical protein POM88_027703 [Heracleum sosnowskyi]